MCCSRVSCRHLPPPHAQSRSRWVRFGPAGEGSARVGGRGARLGRAPRAGAERLDRPLGARARGRCERRPLLLLRRRTRRPGAPRAALDRAPQEQGACRKRRARPSRVVGFESDAPFSASCALSASWSVWACGPGTMTHGSSLRRIARVVLLPNGAVPVAPTRRRVISQVWVVAVAPSGAAIAAGDYANVVRVYAHHNGATLWQKTSWRGSGPPFTWGLAWAGDGRTLVIGHWDACVAGGVVPSLSRSSRAAADASAFSSHRAPRRRVVTPSKERHARLRRGRIGRSTDGVRVLTSTRTASFESSSAPDRLSRHLRPCPTIATRRRRRR